MFPINFSFHDNIHLEYTLLFFMIIGLLLILFGSTYLIIKKKNIINDNSTQLTDTEKYSKLSIVFGICFFFSAVILQIIYCYLNVKCLEYL